MKPGDSMVCINAKGSSGLLREGQFYTIDRMGPPGFVYVVAGHAWRVRSRRGYRMTPDIFLDGKVAQYCGDVLTVLRTLPADHFDCVVTSPPYWGLRDYGTARWEGGDVACDHLNFRPGASRADGVVDPSKAQRSPDGRGSMGGNCKKCGAIRIDDQIGLERSLGEHLAVMVPVFAEVRRVLKPTGTLWLNYGDCYATSPNGRSADATKAAGNDDRTFRDKPFSTIGAIYDPNHRPAGSNRSRGRNSGSKQVADNVAVPLGRVVAGGFLKAKDLCMVPNRLAIALQDDGWWVRSEIIWHKPNPMPESTRDRPTSSHEKIWLMTKAERYFYDAEAIAEPASPSTHARISQNLAAQVGSFRANGGDKTNGPMKAVMKGSTRKLAESGSGVKNNRSFKAACSLVVETRNSRNVWTMGTQPFSEAHFATFPPELAERCIKAGSSEVGCCSACGRPWARTMERTDEIDASAKGSRFDKGKTGARDGGDRTQPGERFRKVVTGWAPSCRCDAPIEPARVLDIFGGSGTTGMVAVSLGRTATLIELSPEYCTLARARIEAAFMGKDEGARHMVKKLGKTEDAGPLFAPVDSGDASCAS